MLTTITLHGKLGEAVGRDVWHIAVGSVGEALRAIEAQTGRLFQYLRSEGKGRAEYRVLLNGADFDDMAQIQAEGGEHRSIDIVPVPSGGSGLGLFETILGVVLIVVGLATSCHLLAVLGVGLLLSGISSFLFPAQGLPSQGNQATNVQNYVFNSDGNNVGQGHPVPVVYGEMMVGSSVISAQITETAMSGSVQIGMTPSTDPTSAAWVSSIAAILGTAHTA